jgi:hypothetical protein
MTFPDTQGREHIEVYRRLRRRYAPFRLVGFVSIIVGFVGLVLSDVRDVGRAVITVWFFVALVGLLVAMVAQSRLRCPVCGHQPFGRNVWDPEFCTSCGAELQ